ncbi:hypothetical protein H4S02_009572 [Coemansia sp. RSA 2611]|nr:hypothetical protein H4S02_009572 [Coemansia sp. RSA 2611]
MQIREWQNEQCDGGRKFQLYLEDGVTPVSCNGTFEKHQGTTLVYFDFTNTVGGKSAKRELRVTE